MGMTNYRTQDKVAYLEQKHTHARTYTHASTHAHTLAHMPTHMRTHRHTHTQNQYTKTLYPICSTEQFEACS